MAAQDDHFDGYIGGIKAAASIAKAYEEAQAEAALNLSSEAERAEGEARSFAGGEIAKSILALLPS